MDVGGGQATNQLRLLAVRGEGPRLSSILLNTNGRDGQVMIVLEYSHWMNFGLPIGQALITRDEALDTKRKCGKLKDIEI